MIKPEKGFTLLELVISVALMAALALGGTAVCFQTIRVSDKTAANLTVVAQLENAAFWVGRDVLMADNIFTENLTPPNFIILAWIEHVYGSDQILHTVTYSFENIEGNICKLRRYHWTSDGVNTYTMVADHIYYNTDDPDNSTAASYINPALSLKLTSSYGNKMESRNYSLSRRSDFR